MDDVLLVSGLVLTLVGISSYVVGPLGMLGGGIVLLFIGLIVRADETQ